MSRIALNACHDWLRRVAARPLVTYSDLGEDEREILERTLAADEPRRMNRRTMLHELLDRLIATLAPREQIVIRLLDLERPFGGGGLRTDRVGGLENQSHRHARPAQTRRTDETARTSTPDTPMNEPDPKWQKLVAAARRTPPGGTRRRHRPPDFANR